jgi:hypothetical protein
MGAFMTRTTAIRRGVVAAVAVLAGAALAPAAATAATASLATASPAQAGVSGLIFPVPSGRYIGTYFNYTLCARAGAAGVQNGQWTSYSCVPKSVGLDVYWALYVNP